MSNGTRISLTSGNKANDLQRKSQEMRMAARSSLFESESRRHSDHKDGTNS